MFLLQTVPDAMVLSDRNGKMMLVNQHTEKMFGYTQAQLIGKKVEILLPVRLRARHRKDRAAYCKDPTVRAMGSLGELAARRKDGSEFPVEISLSPVDIDGDMFIWSAIRDVSERHRLITNLRMALEEVNMLSGLLSICASCKKIRDKHGNWQQLESYIQEHSEAKFSHGICPECLRKMDPGYEPESR